jgi:hypothetical protein
VLLLELLQENPMKMRTIYLLLSVSLVGCGYMRSLFTHRIPVEDDRSIRFPDFSEHVPIDVGEGGKPYELDGEMLRALVIASNDYSPPDVKDLPCADRQEAQFYRVIRQGNIIFVYIHENFTYCGRQYPVHHSGMRYAISTDGRILRRLLEEIPDHPIEPETPDGRRRRIKAEPGVSEEFESMWNTPRDGGTAPPVTDGGALLLDGGSSGPDAG